MTPPSTGTGPALFAYLSYRDAPAALDWFTALGFEVVTRQNGSDGVIVHSEVRLGVIVLMIASADGDYDTRHCEDAPPATGFTCVSRTWTGCTSAPLMPVPARSSRQSPPSGAVGAPASSTRKGTSGASVVTSPARALVFRSSGRSRRCQGWRLGPA